MKRRATGPVGEAGIVTVTISFELTSPGVLVKKDSQVLRPRAHRRVNVSVGRSRQLRIL